jgi:hypothetical protein
MRVKYPKGSSSPSLRPQGGCGFFAIPRVVFPSDDVTLSYDVKFAPNFDPHRGGKLPGLHVCRGRGVSGASGGKRHPINGSCRVMWRAGFAAEAYVYPPAYVRQDRRYFAQRDLIPNPDFGDSLGRRTLRLKKDTWNRVTLRIRMNTVGKADGLVQLTINDVTYKYQAMVWRNDASVSVGAMYFSTFFGGKRDFATPHDTYAVFRNFRLIIV